MLLKLKLASGYPAAPVSTASSSSVFDGIFHITRCAYQAGCKLKIDPICGLSDQKPEMTLIPTILGMARAPNLAAVAEGVDNRIRATVYAAPNPVLRKASRVVPPANIPALREHVWLEAAEKAPLCRPSPVNVKVQAKLHTFRSAL